MANETEGTFYPVVPYGQVESTSRDATTPSSEDGFEPDCVTHEELQRRAMAQSSHRLVSPELDVTVQWPGSVGGRLHAEGRQVYDVRVGNLIPSLVDDGGTGWAFSLFVASDRESRHLTTFEWRLVQQLLLEDVHRVVHTDNFGRRWTIQRTNQEEKTAWELRHAPSNPHFRTDDEEGVLRENPEVLGLYRSVFQNALDLREFNDWTKRFLAMGLLESWSVEKALSGRHVLLLESQNGKVSMHFPRLVAAATGKAFIPMYRTRGEPWVDRGEGGRAPIDLVKLERLMLGQTQTEVICGVAVRLKHAPRRVPTYENTAEFVD